MRPKVTALLTRRLSRYSAARPTAANARRSLARAVLCGRPRVLAYIRTCNGRYSHLLMLVDDEEFYNMQKPFPLSNAHPCHTPTQTYRTGAARTRRGAAAVQRPEHTVIRGRPALVRCG